MQGFLNAVNSVVWGLPMLVLFAFTGIRFTIKGRFFQLTGVKKSLKILLKAFKRNKNSEGISSFSAFCSVLGACIGTGNIVGIATAVYSGGPGTVFWMILSAVFSMMTAYAENFLGAKYTSTYYFRKSSTGAFAYIENGLNMGGLAKIYGALCLCSVFGMGNMTQSNSLCDSIKVTFNVSPIFTAIVISLIALLIINGGIRRIARFQTILVPVSAIFYFFISFAVLLKFNQNIIPVIKLIFTEAFSLEAVTGFGMYKAMRYGFSRGVFSNEAGLGSSTLLHSQASSSSPEAQGITAMAEVFIDTVLMCTITALVVLVSTDANASGLYGSELSSQAYSTIGAVGKFGVGILTAVFSFMSLTSCSFYGETSFNYLFGEKYIRIYRIIYIIFVFIGGVFSPKLIWELADICNGLMAIPNLFAINCLNREVDFPKVKAPTRKDECLSFL